jgi:hypothetical protein
MQKEEAGTCSLLASGSAGKMFAVLAAPGTAERRRDEGAVASM